MLQVQFVSLPAGHTQTGTYIGQLAKMSGVGSSGTENEMGPASEGTLITSFPFVGDEGS